MSTYLDELQKIQRQKLILLVGAGVTIQATNGVETASWKGLLAHGAKFTRSRRRTAENNYGTLKNLIQSGNSYQMAAAGELITRDLGGVKGIDYRDWLGQAFEQLEAQQPEILEAINGAGIPIITTNYDSLLESATGLQPITWQQHVEVNKFVSGDIRAIFHLHGYWKAPESVILGTKSYDSILSDTLVQSTLQTLVTMKTLVFAGFGAGLDDDNFVGLRNWMKEVIKSEGRRHYILVLNQDVDNLNTKLDDWIRAVGYGDSYTELPQFIKALWPPVEPGDFGAETNLDNKGKSRGKLKKVKVTPAKSQMENVLKLADLVKRAQATMDGLVEATVQRRRPNSFLYPSNTTDANPSITVSGMAMLALHTAQDRNAQFVCDDVLSARIKEGDDEGAWKGQGDTHCHSLAAAWALLACLRTRPSCVITVENSVSWLIRQQSPESGGWGYHPTEPRAFYTAYVLNALIEYVNCAAVIGLNVEKVESKIKEGSEFLLNESLRSCNPGNILLWSKDPKGSDFCLASTAMAVFVLANRYKNFNNSQLILSALKESVELLCRVMKDGPPPRGKQIQLPLKEERIIFEPWPQFLENGPNYWFHYFTPLVSITLMDAARELKIVRLPLLLDGVTNTVRWIIQRAVVQADQMLGVPAREDETRIAIWPTVQSIIILSRWLDALMSVLADPEVFSQLKVKATN
jgi:hypothetical protein